MAKQTPTPDTTPDTAPTEQVTKTLGNTDASKASVNVSDLVIYGDGDLFKLLSKASSQSEGWFKSTKAMQAGDGCVVQVTTQQRNPDGTYAVAEAVTYVPRVRIFENMDGDEVIARHLVPYL